MSVNGVCPIFEGDDGQVKDVLKTSTYDATKEDEIFGEKDIKEKKAFQFDFELPTSSAFETADNIISNNLNSYNEFVEQKLGIPTNVSNLFTVGSAIATGSLLPFATKFIAGAFLNNQNQQRIQNITDQDTQGDINILDFSNSGSPNPYGGGDTGIQSGMTSPTQTATTSQGVTSAQHAAFRS